MNRIPPAQPQTIPDEITAHLNRLVSAFPSIQAIWSFGSRANGAFHADSDWDFLIFADRATLDALRADDAFRRPGVDIFIVHDGTRFESPWPGNAGAKTGRLNNGIELESERYVYGYRWRQLSETEAVYLSTRDFNCTDRLRAYRIFPK